MNLAPPADVFLADRIAQLQPDLVIVMFTNDSDISHVTAAVAAGVTAYIVAGLAPERIRPILDVAMARFQHDRELRQQAAQAGDGPGPQAGAGRATHDRRR